MRLAAATVRWFEQLAPVIVALLGIMSILVYLSGVSGAPQAASGGAAAQAPDSAIGLYACLACTAAIAVLWSVHAFTGDPYERRTQQIRFAYFFVAGSFMVFVLPVTVTKQGIGTEPLGIVSACVRNESSEQLLSCRKHAAPEECDRLTDVATALACDRNRKPANFHWVLNVGGSVSEAVPALAGKSPYARYAIEGGVVVPLPFLIIALVGGAISMSRRIPEIQKRSESHYVGTEAEPKLLPCEVREQLAFQMLQFASAPLLAIVAYQVVRPENESTAAALAFMCGFGSASVLHLIRGVFDSIKPRSLPATLPKAALIGRVRRGATAVAGAQVALADGSRTTTTGQDGSFALHDLPIGTGQVIASNGGTQRAIAFNLAAGGAFCDIDLDGAAALTDGTAAPALPVTVAVRIDIPTTGIDADSLKLDVDGENVQVGDDGLIELSLTTGSTHVLIATASRGGKTVTGSLRIAPTPENDGTGYQLELK